MQSDKASKEFAKKLVALSVEDGQISEEKVSAVLEVIKNKPARQAKAILKAYASYLRQEVKRSTISIEYAGSLNMATINQLQEFFSKQYGKELSIEANENKQLIAGLKVVVGDDVYDSTAAGRLKALALATA